MRNILICGQRSSILPVCLFFCLFFLSCTSIKHTCTSIFFPCKCSVTPTLNACLSHVQSNTCVFTIISFRWLCVCCVKQHACFTFLHSMSDQAAYCYSSHFFFSIQFSISLKHYIDPPTLKHHETYSCHQHCWSQVIWLLGKASGEVEVSPPLSSLTSLPL